MWSKGRVFLKVCIFCDSSKTSRSPSKRGKRAKEKLRLCETHYAQDTIKRAANARNDQKLKKKIEGECLIAKEACYHRTCYRDYTRFDLPELILPRQRPPSVKFKYDAALLLHIPRLVSAISTKWYVTSVRALAMFKKIVGSQQQDDVVFLKFGNLRRHIERLAPQVKFTSKRSSLCPCYCI
jgi:hypothetical protein